jgi:primosomal protein N' (replication factor Y)
MIAEVILNSNAKQLNKVFDYEIPESLASKVMIGSRVFVPFANRKELDEGYVVAIKESSPYKLKPIVQVEDNLFVGEKEINLAYWMAKRYFCNVSDCIKLMLPPGTTAKIIQNRVKEKSASFVYLMKEAEEIEAEIVNNGIKSEKQIRALQFLMENDGALISDLEIFADVSRAVLKSLEKKGYIELIEKQVERNPFLHKQIKQTQDLNLNEEQQKAFATICEAMDDCFYSEFLLFGVTGSRKNRSLFTVNRKSFKRRKI